MAYWIVSHRYCYSQFLLTRSWHRRRQVRGVRGRGVFNKHTHAHGGCGGDGDTEIEDDTLPGTAGAMINSNNRNDDVETVPATAEDFVMMSDTLPDTLVDDGMIGGADDTDDNDFKLLEKIIKDAEVFEELVELEATLGPAAL